MARSLALRDWVQVREIARTLFSSGAVSVTTTIAGGPTFSYPERLQNTACGVVLRAPIERYGLNLGKVEVCMPLRVLLGTALREPWLLFAVLLLNMLTMGSVIWRLNLYRRSLQRTLVTLRSWAQAPASELPPHENDHVTEALISLVREGVERKLASTRTNLQQEASAALVQQAAKTAHDIRGPVAALGAVLPALVDAESDVRELAQGAIARITAIADDLLMQKRGSNADKAHNVDLGRLVAQVVQEIQTKQRCQGGVCVVLNSTSMIYRAAGVNPHEFGCVAANLINNAVEAAAAHSEVAVTVGQAKDRVFVEVRDSGPGMGTHTLQHLGQEGATFGKVKGNGLGVYHAFEFARQHQGSLIYCSSLGQGTAVRLYLSAAA